jgi:hypothetical protein
LARIKQGIDGGSSDEIRGFFPFGFAQGQSDKQNNDNSKSNSNSRFFDSLIRNNPWSVFLIRLEVAE